MNVVVIVARVLLGLAFTAVGLMGLYLVITSWSPPPASGLANEFQSISYRSHYVVFVAVVQLITGVLLLVNRYVPLALVTIAAVLANILVFHITMMPLGIFPGLFLTICWFIIAYAQRSAFASLLASRS